MLPVLSRPDVRAMWKITRDQYSTDFAAYIDQCIAETPVVPVLDRHARRKAELATMVGNPGLRDPD